MHRQTHTVLVGRGGDVLAEGGADLVEDVGVDGGEVARELVAHDRNVELVVDARAERVPQLQHLYAYYYNICVRARRERGEKPISSGRRQIGISGRSKRKGSDGRGIGVVCRREKKKRGTHLGRALHSGQLVIRRSAELIDELGAREDYQPAVQHGDFENGSVELQHIFRYFVSAK